MVEINVNALKNLSLDLGATVVDQSNWTIVLDRISEAMKCKGCALLPRAGGSFPTSSSMVDPFKKYMEEGWYHYDLRLRGVALQLRGASVVVDDDVAAEEERLRSPHHSEFLPSVGLKWWAGTAVWAGRDLWCLALQRSAEEGRFSMLEKSVLSDFSVRLSEVA